MEELMLYRRLLSLRTATGPTTVLALITASVPRHQPAALRTQRRIRHHRSKRQLLLRLRLRGLQHQRVAHLRRRVLWTQEPRPEPTENIIHDRLRIRNLLIARPPARLKPHVAELVDQKLSAARHTAAQS